MSRSKSRSLAASAVLLVALAGCKSKPASVSDAALTSSIQTQLAGDASLAGQSVQANVSGAVATLNGTVLNDAQRTIAARDAAGVTGIKEVVNNISILPAQPVSQTATTAPPASIPVPIVPLKERTVTKPAPLPRELPPPRESAPIERSQQAYNPPPQPVQQAPPPPPRPAFRNVTVDAGTSLSVRITQTLDSATTQQGDSFSGVTSSDVIVDGAVAIPSGSAVSGRVDEVHEAAHFKGASLLTVSLTGLTRRGDRVAITTDPYTVEGKGRGKNTAEKTGGGAAVGAILGGIFGGGKGAAIGAGAGAGVGAGANAVTRGQQVQIPSETVVRFRLTTPMTLKVRTDDHGDNHGDRRDGNNDNGNGSSGTLQPRN